MNEHYLFLVSKLDEFIRKYYLNKILKGSLYLLTTFSGAYLLVTFAEYWGNFNQLTRAILFYSFLSFNLFLLIYFIVIPLLAYFKLGKIISYENASIIIGNHFQPVKDKLLNTLQLKKLAQEDIDHRSLIEASISQRVKELQLIPFSSAIHLKDNTKYIKYALIPLSVIFSLLFLAPSILNDSTKRLLHFNKNFIKKAPFEIEILNKNLVALEGEDFEINIKLSGNEIPQEIYMEDGNNTFKLEKESLVRFKYQFKNIQQNKTIQFLAGDYLSESYIIKVKKRPSLLNFTTRLIYPAYLNKKNEVVNNTGDLRVPVGTNLIWDIKTQNTDQLKFNTEGRNTTINPNAEGSFKIIKRALSNFSYSFIPLNDEVKTTNDISYTIQVIPDLYPDIIVKQNADSVNNKLIYFIGQLNDDHGFSKLTFNTVVRETDKVIKRKVLNIPFNKTSNQSSFFYPFNVNNLEANAGQTIEYYFEIWDNDGVNGPKSKKSDIKLYTLLSATETEKKLDDGTESVKNKIEQAIRKAAQVEKEARQINQSLLEKKNLSYEDKKQIDQLLSRQKELENLVKDIQKENKQNLFNREENQDQRQEILKKQKQIEDLFNNILDEKTREILKNIEKLLEQNNKNLTRDELSKMQVDQKSLQKELDRILELYKQLEFDQKLAAATDKLKDLAKDQENLSTKTLQNKSEVNQLKQEQKDLKSKFSEIRENLNELEEKNKSLEHPNDFTNPDEDQESIENLQKQSSENLDKQNLKSSSEKQKKAAEQMSELAQKLENMQQQEEMEENEINIQSLREILDNLISTSFDQEKVMQSHRNTNVNDPIYFLNIQKQKDIKDHLKMIEDSLYSLSKRVPQIQTVVNKEIQTINFNVKTALESLADRQTAEANRSQQFAMTSINNLALMLSEALDQLQKAQKNAKSGSKGKKSQSLSQLSKMQDQLNKNMQKARQQMQQEGKNGQARQGKGSMSEQLAKMAREQQMIRQAMQEINRELNKDGQSGLGNLDKVMKQMEQSETDLVNRKIQQETIIRQQEILTKLLEADKAEREREQDIKRESKKGIELAPDYKIYLKEYQKIKQKETELLKTVPPSLNSFYKIKVGDYFKFLNSGN
ncbi:coiled-coil domain-containing protein [Daejeonella oryzae]|uniref:hypothetical protein n=1 Tax=Daejeonella oryzae TaxID=1122943 RepID=UPI000402BFF3|nr:hypothetical protein [Daejeonella oryzae]